MTAFSTIKVGDVLFDCRRQKMGNTQMSRMATWRVVIKDVDADKRRALASWNGNKEEWWSERDLKRLRRSPIASTRS